MPPGSKREITTQTPIVTNADLDESIDILHLAGSTYVYQFMKLLGQALARRALASSSRANIIGRFEQLVIAEVEVRQGEQWYHLRTALTGVAGKVLQATGVKITAPVRPQEDNAVPSEMQKGGYPGLKLSPGLIYSGEIMYCSSFSSLTCSTGRFLRSSSWETSSLSRRATSSFGVMVEQLLRRSPFMRTNNKL